MTAGNDNATFSDALKGCHEGSFRLEPLFDDRSGRSGKPQIVEWHEQGRLRDQPKALAEALTCASFLGRTSVAEYLLKQGVDPSGGAGTGLDAIHWASNRGQLEAVRLLIRAKAPLETRSMYGGTASARQSGRLSTNRGAIICKSSKSCSMRVPVWTIRNIPPGTSALTPSWSVTGRCNHHSLFTRLAPRAASPHESVVYFKPSFLAAESSSIDSRMRRSRVSGRLAM